MKNNFGFFAFIVLLAALPASAALINVAASANGGVASQSSTASGDTAMFGPQWVNDGDPSGNYMILGHIQHTEEEQDPWVQVLFNQTYSIQAFTLYNRQDCCQDRAKNTRFELLLGATSVWSLDLTNLVWPSYTGSFGSTPVNADRFRVTLLGTNALHLGEIEVFANVSDVPEPTTYALMGAGLGALAFFRRRK
ncbi:MAG: PEP-CTERM sorting domain-containing protein [Bryobacter sp.]|jgi:hypothetical protein|nr:PEP-CTERM sorting domain-containing protein [Bryobacter sp. CoA8 C33]